MKSRLFSYLIVAFSVVKAFTGQGQQFVPFFLDNGNSHQYVGGIYGCGATFCDFDKDGFDDLSLPANGTNPVFYKNVNGEMIEFSTGILNQDEIKHLVWVDYDNDGDRDLCMTGIDMPVRLFNNDGAMNLTEVSAAAGFPYSEDMTYGNCWADFDRDGDLDVFVAKYDEVFPVMTNVDNELYRNNGDGTFTNVAYNAGIIFETNYTFMGLWMDYNNDLWPDLLITNDRTEAPNYLFHNNGDGTFTDVSDASGMNDFIWSMSNTSDDYDNDGDADLYITNGPMGNVHKQNNGNGVFEHVANEMNTVVNRFCWSAQFLDADNDGWLDLHVCSTPTFDIPGGVVFMKNNQFYFSDSTAAAGLVTESEWCRGSAVGDLNNDGFPDIVVTKSSPSYSSFWQSVPNGNNWMKVSLDGVISNEDGIGSRIELYADDQLFSRFTHCGEAYNAQNSFAEFFGLAQIDVVDSIRVFWPSGIVDVWERIPVNQHLRLEEGTSQPAELSIAGSLQICADTLVSLSHEWPEVIWFDGSTDAFVVCDSSTMVYAEVHDSSGNRFLTDTLNLVVFVPPTITAEIVSPHCYGGNNGSFMLNGIQPEEVDEIIWSNNAIAGLSAEGVASGLFFYQLMTMTGCVISDSVFVSQPENLTVDFSTEDVLCAGSASGSALIVPSGGVEPYTIDTGNVADLSQLSSGTYPITIADAMGCIIESEFVIHQPDSILVMVATTDVGCNGYSGGTAALDIFGGSGSYQILWNGLDSLNLAAGKYQVTVIDGNGCTAIAGFEILEPEPLSAWVHVEPYIEGVQSGSALLTISGGAGPYHIVWGVGIEDEMYVEYSQPGTDSVLITDANGCSLLLSFEIEMNIDINNTDQFKTVIYPNPAADKLYFTNIPEGHCELHVTDILGRNQTIIEFHRSEKFIDITSLSPGDYRLVLKSDDGVSIIHFIKQ